MLDTILARTRGSRRPLAVTSVGLRPPSETLYLATPAAALRFYQPPEQLRVYQPAVALKPPGR